MSQTAVKIGGKRLALTNLDKELYPAAGFTKAHVLDYYRRMAAAILPHLRGRAVTLKRYPDGVAGESFFEKRCPPHRPAWVETAQVRHRDAAEPTTACVVNDLETLIWVENLASIELHVPLARAASPGKPDFVVFDLDPGAPAGILDCARVALVVRDLLSGLGLAGFVKASGMKGLHVFVPLNRGEATFEDTKRFSKAVAERLESGHPELVTAKMARDARKGRVFINWSQNSASMTMVCVYSLRAAEKPMVSFPLSWAEVEQAAHRGSPAKLRVDPAEALSRVEGKGDLFREVLRKKQRLPGGEVPRP